MKIEVGDKFVRDTFFGGLTFKVVEIKYYWDRYANLQETIVYKNESGTIWKKPRHLFEVIIKRFNAHRIPKGEIVSVQSYIPRHKFL